MHRRYCSKACWYGNVPKRVNHKWKYSKKAARVSRRLRYRIAKGEIIRPDKCAKCKKIGFIEAAHWDYEDISHYIWLCRSCHKKWDWEYAKGGCEKVDRWEKFTGKKAKKI